MRQREVRLTPPPHQTLNPETLGSFHVFLPFPDIMHPPPSPCPPHFHPLLLKLPPEQNLTVKPTKQTSWHESISVAQ